MITPKQALIALPEGLRKPLLAEYNDIIKNYIERRWSPSELSGGKFSEIVYTILHGSANGKYPSSPCKPNNFVEACRKLENNAHVKRSFQILIPRMLPALYEIRNNRGVGHVGGDVDPNNMDSTVVVSMSSWIMAELVRVFHNLNISDVQRIVDSLVERRIPVVWQSGDLKRVLRQDLCLKDKILLLISSCPNRVNVGDLFKWSDYKNRTRFNDALKQLHTQRYIEFYTADKEVEMLPPGDRYVSEILSSLTT